MEKLVYLAGAMNYFRDKDYNEAKGWRLVMKQKLVSSNDNYGTRFTVFDPTLEEDKYHDIVTQNLYYLRKADILVINLNALEHSLGSIYELAYFSYTGKPIITIGGHNWLSHPYLEKFVSMRVDTVREAADFIRRMYGQ